MPQAPEMTLNRASWDELKKPGVTTPKSAEKIRGKLNVPRERFRLTPDKRYRWAGEKQP